MTESNEKIGGIAPKKKERKEQMSIMLTPTHKERVRETANELNMSVSELIGEWIERYAKKN